MQSRFAIENDVQTDTELCGHLVMGSGIVHNTLNLFLTKSKKDTEIEKP